MFFTILFNSSWLNELSLFRKNETIGYFGVWGCTKEALHVFIMSHNICVKTYLPSSDYRGGVSLNICYNAQKTESTQVITGQVKMPKIPHQFPKRNWMMIYKVCHCYCMIAFFSNKLSSSFPAVNGLRYRTGIGSGLERCHSTPKDSAAPCQLAGGLPVGESLYPPVSSYLTGHEYQQFWPLEI